MSTQQTPPAKPASTYEVARPSGTCAVTGQVIEPGARLMAALRETDQGFERVDVSIEAWPSFDRSRVLAFWQTVMPRADQVKKKLFVDDQVLCELFERISGTSESSKLNFRFVLGLILMRKRLLLYETSRREGHAELWSVRFKGSEKLMDLLNPDLNEQQMMEVSQQLGEILNEEL